MHTITATALLLIASVASLAQAQSFPQPTTPDYINWLITNDPSLAGAPSSCVNALADPQTCFCSKDSDAITRATIFPPLILTFLFSFLL
ncbi:hypothetical protein BDR26DRAFT_869059 [Obelidium mucronatum]|nr:hypothetical protein BDR26DRAFT_869059 [Obelidium mucronatum]